MATKNPRVMAVLEPELYKRIKEAAQAEGVSVSAKVRDLLRDAVALDEDAYWAELGAQRLRSFDRKKAVPHKDAWK
jgi:class 3 adenylate cyclase